ncbi:MAG: TRAP-type C4-dicarboxylate transport system, small permease component [candidate division NC10 bacterium]|nr:TRAP-type C4-dicarboxylate transport system, small permease component [candidate division NC10 bacterium]
MRSLLDRVVGGVLALILGVMTILVFASVVLRYVMNSPVTWSEELASLLFAWITFVGAFVGFRSRSHIAIDTLVVFLPRTARRAIGRMADVVVLCVLGLFVWQGVRLCVTTWGLEFPAMEISRGYLYLSLPLGASLMIVAVVEHWRDARRTPGADDASRERRP